MSLDRTYETLARFAAELHAFDEMLRRSQGELGRHRQALDGLWQDEARREHDVAMADLDAELERYVRSEAEHYENFLDRKLMQLRQYLQG